MKSHVSSAGERWAVLKKAGAIGIATFPNPRPPARTTTDTDASPTRRPPRAGGRGAGTQAPQPTIVLADRELQEQAGQAVSITADPRGAEKLLAGSGHTIDELNQLIADKKPLPTLSAAGNPARPRGASNASRSIPRTSSASTKDRIRR